MKLWCSKCHTQWTEGVLMVGNKCPFKDCDGHLSGQSPPVPAKLKEQKQRPTFPLLESDK